jgi:Zn-dependent oligopeptidase
LNDAIMQLSRRFFRQDNANLPAETFTVEELGQDTTSTENGEFQRLLRPKWGKVEIKPASWQASTLYREHPSESVRKRAYHLAYPAASEAINGLDDMLKARQQLARLVGCQTFAELALKEKMAQSPGAQLPVHHSPLFSPSAQRTS